ncbi:ATP-binding SpoIIE family protein phosphatase [Streptomyces sp.]|uniref:ATP-binding SpoIIE family protein phosphatase n=1 Tax=Streptomyces sp. TaxID=1931 RepID=UPI002D3E99A9|nr:ATP-binding SpoIIE family protein phosphatase [Streptomyces sp.]HZF92349.1 ATP-binding SpoIIE family protein phosphatase [Streptomyces sp.]
MNRAWDVPVHDSTRVRDVRVAAETACREARLGPHRTAIAALVATELATNLLKHADGGRVVINLAERPAANGPDRAPAVQLVAVDHGPGIADVAAARRDGFTTTPSSLGAGLGTCLRISNAFDLYSVRGRGTVALARVDPEPAPWPTSPRVGGINIPLAPAEHSGDAWTWARSGPLLTLMLADGLGHGTRAAEASAAAVGELHRTAHLAPAEILRRLDSALRRTRGAAVAVAQLDTGARALRFAGVGNAGARLRTADGWQPLISHPGIVGAAFPATVPVQQVPWTEDSLLVLHSDGLPSRWTPPDDPHLLTRDPALIAAVVLRDAGSAASPARDDTSVAVLAPECRTEAHDPP